MKSVPSYPMFQVTPLYPIQCSNFSLLAIKIQEKTGKHTHGYHTMHFLILRSYIIDSSSKSPLVVHNTHFCTQLLAMAKCQANSPPVFLVVIVLLLLGLDSHFCLEYTATHVSVPNECDFLTCAEGPHVKSISEEARAPPRQRLSRYKYLAPANNVQTVILIEQCYTVCFDRVSGLTRSFFNWNIHIQ